jgi:hypothetical protein
MNALYTHALRQTQSITSDLALLEGSLSRQADASTSSSSSSPAKYGSNGGYSSRVSPSLQGNGVDTAGLNGQIVASLAALQRTVEDYEGMAKRELVEANKAKAQRWVELDVYTGWHGQEEEVVSTGISHIGGASLLDAIARAFSCPLLYLHQAAGMHAHLLTRIIHHGSRVERIKNDYSTLKAQYDNIKKMQSTQVCLI